MANPVLSLNKYPSQPTNIMREEAPPIAKYMYHYVSVYIPMIFFAAIPRID